MEYFRVLKIPFENAWYQSKGGLHHQQEIIDFNKGKGFNSIHIFKYRVAGNMNTAFVDSGLE